MRSWNTALNRNAASWTCSDMNNKKRHHTHQFELLLGTLRRWREVTEASTHNRCNK